MDSEAALDTLALIVVFVSIAALAVSLCYSIPYSLARLAMYPGEGARRTFARMTLYQIVAPTVVVVCFLVVGAAILVMEDTPARAALSRVSLLIAILITAAQAVLTPIGHRLIQERANAERREIAAGHERRHGEARERERAHEERHEKEDT